MKFSDKQREMNASTSSKIEAVSSSNYVFKRKGNEEQYKHSVKVLDKLQEATSNLSTDSEEAKYLAISKISDGMDLICYTKKLIKFADSSKHGWKLIQNYESNELADDSNDEKKAENKCEKQAKDERQGRDRLSRRFTPYQWNKNSNRPVNAGVTTQTNSTKERTDKISIYDFDLSIVGSGEHIVSDDVKKVSAKNNLISPVRRPKKGIDMAIEFHFLTFLLKKENCDWKPKQYTTWLGCDWNFLEATVSITEDRIQRLLDNLNIVISQVSSGSLLLKARTLASISGQIISMKSGIGNIVRFITRYLFYCLQTRASWNSPVLADYRVLEELTFWKEHLRIKNNLPYVVIAVYITSNLLFGGSPDPRTLDQFLPALDIGFQICPKRGYI
ncbi:hypothetical protein KUTeg_008990 [Tegillarca granosa]|uniref:Uncharacterized protein n=1 Tax=Tegillarca granosa TaxID=220873 RepID=A0ABQ9FA23_TEGGR|nr:hypothetical protein KUTeg_008990 [Tegillarca granosa]